MEKLEPFKDITTKTRGTYSWSPFGTRSNIYVMHLLPMQYAAGIDHSIVSTAVAERMQAIPRNAAKKTFRGITPDGKTQCQAILEQFDVASMIGRDSPQHIERWVKKNARKVKKRVLLLKPGLRMKTNVDRLNLKTADEILGVHYLVPIAGIEDAEQVGVAVEMDNEENFQAHGGDVMQGEFIVE